MGQRKLFVATITEKYFQSNDGDGDMCAEHLCDNTHHVIYDDFLVTQNKRRETTVPYLKRKRKEVKHFAH